MSQRHFFPVKDECFSLYFDLKHPMNYNFEQCRELEPKAIYAKWSNDELHRTKKISNRCLHCRHLKRWQSIFRYFEWIRLEKNLSRMQSEMFLIIIFCFYVSLPVLTYSGSQLEHTSMYLSFYCPHLFEFNPATNSYNKFLISTNIYTVDVRWRRKW